MSLADGVKAAKEADAQSDNQRDETRKDLRRKLHFKVVEGLGPTLYDRQMSDAELKLRVMEMLEWALDQEQSVALTRTDRLGLLQEIADDIAMHVAAADPSPVAVDREGVPQELIEREKELFRRQAEQEGKPEKVIDRIVEGKLRKFVAEACLLEQAFVKDPDRSVGDLLNDVGKEVGAEVAVGGFRRFKLGEASET